MKCYAKKKLFSNVLFSPLRCSCLACRRRGKWRWRNSAMQIFKICKYFYGKRFRIFFAWFIMVEVPVPSPLLLLEISDETLSPSSISSSSDSSDIRLSLSLILAVSTSTSTSSLLASSSKARCSRLALSSPAALLHFKKHPLFKALFVIRGERVFFHSKVELDMETARDSLYYPYLS